MPKDPTKNIDRYKIRGGNINEFEYHENQEAFAEQNASAAEKLIPGTPPEEKAKKMRPVVAKKPAKQAVKKKAATKKAAKKASVATRGASAKKLAARKAATKKAAKKK